MSLALYLTETLKLYITQVVVEPAVGDRKPEASLNRQVFVNLVTITAEAHYFIWKK